MRVPYEKPECLARFVLVHEVLLVATKSFKYVWMVEPKADAQHCACQIKPDSEFSYRETHALRQIPLQEVESHLDGYESNGKLRLESLPIKFALRKDKNIRNALRK